MSSLDSVPSFCFPSPSSVTSDQTSPRYSPQTLSLPSLDSVSKLDSRSPFRHDQESHPPASSPHPRSISHHSNWHPSPPSQHSPQYHHSTQHSRLPSSIIPLSPTHTSPTSMHSPHTHQPSKRRHAPSDSDITDYEHNDWRHHKHNHNHKHDHKHNNINSNVNLVDGPERTPTSSFAARTSYSHGWSESRDKGHKHLFYRASDSSAVYTPLTGHPQDNLPSLAPKPTGDPFSSSGPKHASQSPKSPAQLSGSTFKDTDLAGPQIQSARSAPKGPLPIETQIQLLRSVLQHDPFNCPIRRTTQAWECIAREQGIRARTCARRFDNIMQASIAGRDRQTGTEEQVETKKALLEQLLVMMNQPQALVRMQKKRRYRSEEADRKLLLETIRLNPFGQKVGQVAKAWEDIRDALKMKVHARQCIRRVNRMIKPYQLRERMYKGNIPEEMQEGNDELIKQVIQLMKAGGSSALEEEGEEDGYNSNGSSRDDTGSDSDFQDEAYQQMGEDEDQDISSRTDRVQRAAEGSDIRAHPSTSGVTHTSARLFVSSRTTSSNSAWASSERSERTERGHGHGNTTIPGGMTDGAIGGYSTFLFTPERRNDAQDFTAPPPPHPSSFSGEGASSRFPFLPAALDELQSPSTQLYATILGEFRAVKRFMDQLDDQRQRDKHNQRSMMHMIEKLQYQMRQNQRQIEDLQSQLEFGPWKMHYDSGTGAPRVFQTSPLSSSPYSGRDAHRPRSPSEQSRHHHREGKSRDGPPYQGGSQGHGHSRELRRVAHGSVKGGWEEERRDVETKRLRETLL
ncbi:hypothetical protein BG000_001106 [Podila horticola]|nr:hypothetical protein BG000_001106 [Podila horticola]